jgi:hypothetical protein
LYVVPKEAEIVLAADITLEPDNADLRILTEDALVGTKVERIVAINDAIAQTLTVVLRKVTCSAVVRCIHDAERVLTAPSGKLGRDIGIDDRTRVDDVETALKDIDPFKKERTLLGKENRKPKIRGADRSVGLDLREVGVICEVECDGRRQTELGRELRTRRSRRRSRIAPRDHC